MSLDQEWESVKEEFAEIARAAARIVQQEDLPIEEHVLRACIYRAILRAGTVPKSAMKILERMERAALVEMGIS